MSGPRRRCSRCKSTRPLSGFPPSSGSYCRDCSRAYREERRLKALERAGIDTRTAPQTLADLTKTWGAA